MVEKTIEEQEADHEAKPFPVDRYGNVMAKATAIVKDGVIIKIIVTSPHKNPYD